MAGFEIIDHTADVGIVAYGRTMEELFQNAAAATFSLMADLESVGDGTVLEVEVEAPDREELLVAWLNELIYLSDTERLLFSRFEITEMGEDHLKARVRGERMDPAKHNLKGQVKAATYHHLKISQTEEGLAARVILDM